MFGTTKRRKKRRSTTVKKTRMFGGKRYTLKRSFRKKTDANKFKENCKKKGKSCRCVKSGGMWRVYCRG